jgi:dTDP-4-dehydrorhamnose reductase
MSQPTLVVLGSGGRLGAALAREGARQARVIALNRRQLDLACPQALESALDGLEFDALVNCAALTNVDYCELHPEEAFAVNAQAVRRIAAICERKRARCIHVSTDYVFDGLKRTPYTETDEARPLSVYGESKRQGEREVLNVSGDHLVARVSWVFGPDRPSFVDQMLQRARETDQLQAIGDKWSTPTFTHDLVEWLQLLLWKHPVGGVIHLAQGGVCTWQEYGQHALDCAAEAGIALKGRTVAFQALADLKAFIARRPVYTVLDTRRFSALTGVTPRPWREAVAQYVREIAARG